MGLAFKPNTDDLRDAPSLQIAEKIIQTGARVQTCDPIRWMPAGEQHPDLRILYCNDALSAAEHADALVLVTEWPEFASLELRDLAGRMNNPVPVDGRNVFHADRAREAEFRLYGNRSRASPRQYPERRRTSGSLVKAVKRAPFFSRIAPGEIIRADEAAVRLSPGGARFGQTNADMRRYGGSGRIAMVRL